MRNKFEIVAEVQKKNNPGNTEGDILQWLRSNNIHAIEMAKSKSRSKTYWESVARLETWLFLPL